MKMKIWMFLVHLVNIVTSRQEIRRHKEIKEAWGLQKPNKGLYRFKGVKSSRVSQQVIKQQVSWDIAGEIAVLLRFVKNSVASILSTAKVVTYCAAVHKKVFWFVFGDDAIGYGCVLIEYFVIMVVIVLLSLVSTASYVLVLHVFTFYCQRKLTLFEFKDEFLCYWISAIKEERKHLYMLSTARFSSYYCWTYTKVSTALCLIVLLGLRGRFNTAGLFDYNSNLKARIFFGFIGLIDYEEDCYRLFEVEVEFHSCYDLSCISSEDPYSIMTKKGRILQRYDLQLIMCGDMAGYKGKGKFLFHSGR
ncbi:hypothetical protein Tco_0752248 [Tanacetum coccineum]|uniref:Uncharacterized protein n=1 Tax=Tanacetum coccineum TaxID=301880 RepID=A0ABQ4Z9L7_9ASTR